MLDRIFHSQMALGFAQAAVAALLALITVWIARSRRIHLERETGVALLRGLVQIVLVGSVLVALLRGPQWTSVLVLAAMIVAAATIAARRSRDVPGAWVVALYGVGIGAGLVILGMTLLGVIDAGITSLVPVGSMLIANAMNSVALALDRFRSDVEAHTGLIEAGLALGADPNTTVAPYVQAAVTASLIPRLDSLRSLGIVWIPGLMAGMVLSGTDPVYAAIYQFVVIAMIFGSSGLASIVCILLIRGRAFGGAEQLVMRARAA